MRITKFEKHLLETGKNMLQKPMFTTARVPKMAM